jgi:hypothetical protein
MRPSGAGERPPLLVALDLLGHLLKLGGDIQGALFQCLSVHLLGQLANVASELAIALCFFVLSHSDCDMYIATLW